MGLIFEIDSCPDVFDNYFNCLANTTTVLQVVTLTYNELNDFHYSQRFSELMHGMLVMQAVDSLKKKSIAVELVHEPISEKMISSSDLIRCQNATLDRIKEFFCIFQY